MKNIKIISIIVLILLAVLTAYFIMPQKTNLLINNNQTVLPTNASTNQPPPTNNSVNEPSLNKALQISLPIDNALVRVTKKPFGIYVTPANSLVSPEKFTGYHTGVDFETNVSEQNAEIKIYAICAGPLVLKKYATGYGGVAVQQCQINGNDVTIIYGHLRLSSIAANQNQLLNTGEQIGILGKGYSTETDGERKHLHLGIHKGKNISLLGYVQTAGELNGWIDPLTILK